MFDIFLAFFQDIATYGRIADFGFPIYVNRRQVKRALGQIRHWGLIYAPDHDMLMCTVKQDDAQRAYLALRRAVPILYIPQCIKLLPQDTEKYK